MWREPRLVLQEAIVADTNASAISKTDKNQSVGEFVELCQKVAETDKLTTANRQFGERLEEEKSLYRAAIDSINDPLHVADPD